MRTVARNQLRESSEAQCSQSQLSNSPMRKVKTPPPATVLIVLVAETNSKGRRGRDRIQGAGLGDFTPARFTMGPLTMLCGEIDTLYEAQWHECSSDGELRTWRHMFRDWSCARSSEKRSHAVGLKLAGSPYPAAAFPPR